MKRVDLHTHSLASDGSLSPAQVVAEAKAEGLSAVALTDHDTMAGISEAVEAAKNSGIECIPGIELSAVYGEKEVHIVGLFLDEKNPVLAEKLETIITRTTTNTRMRDFYDIYILEQLHGTTLNPKILHDALLATAHKRGSEKYLNQAEEVFDEVENDSVMQKLWEAYRKKFSYASDLEWDVIMKAIRRLYVLCEKGISL